MNKRNNKIIAIFKEPWRQHPIKHQLYGHLPPIAKTVQVRWTRHAGHCWRSKNELISDILQWTPSHGRAKARQPARTYIQQLSADTGYSLEDFPGAMDDRDGWWERVRDIRAGRAIFWWWWWWYIYIYIYIIIIIIIPWEFFSSALADGLSMEFEWQQVSSSLQDSSQYFGRSQ